MRSKQLVVLLFWVASACSESDGDGFEILDTPMSVEEVNQSMSVMNFVGELPNGQMIDFRPGEDIGNRKGYNYTEVTRTNFLEESEGLGFDVIKLPEEGGSIKLVFERFPSLSSDERIPVDSINVDFQFALITTVGELEEQFPESFDYPAAINHWIVVFGLGSTQLELEEIVEGDYFNVTDFVTYTVDPIRRDGFGRLYDLDPMRTFTYGLLGEYFFFGSTFNCRGDIRIRFPGSNRSGIFGSYDLTINE